MKANGWLEKLGILLVGVVVAVALLVLTGAAGVTEIGRYQMDTVQRGDFTDVYVIDTATGAIKWVDFKDQNLPFDQIKVKKGLFD